MQLLDGGGDDLRPARCVVDHRALGGGLGLGAAGLDPIDALRYE